VALLVGTVALAMLAVGLNLALTSGPARAHQAIAIRHLAAPHRVAAVIPAPLVADPAPIVLPAVPPMPAHAVASDAPALKAHAAMLQTELTAARGAAIASDDRAARAATDATAAQLALARVTERAAAIGAPPPATPPMPTPPLTLTADGALIDVASTMLDLPTAPQNLPAASTEAASAVASSAVVSPTATAVSSAVAATAPTSVSSAVAAAATTIAAPAPEVSSRAVEPPDDLNLVLASAREAQFALETAQLDLVVSLAESQMQQLHANDLQYELVNTELALAFLPGPDPRSSIGCPTDAPDRTLRDGSTVIGLAKLCADSAAAAPTPQAALAIKWALASLGLPYSQELRNFAGWADCSSFVTRAYTAAGVPIAMPMVNAPTTDTIRTSAWAVMEPSTALLPGDLVEPEPGHVVMILAHGFMVHTSGTGDVAHVSVAYAQPWLSLRIDPTAVGKPGHPDPQLTGAVPDLSWMETSVVPVPIVPGVRVVLPTSSPSAGPVNVPPPSSIAPSPTWPGPVAPVFGPPVPPTSVPPDSPTPSPNPTPSPPQSSSPTPSGTPTPTLTDTPAPTPPPSDTPTPSPSDTPTPSPSDTLTPSPSDTAPAASSSLSSPPPVVVPSPPPASPSP
jgi:hypothetical protein